MRGIQSLIYFAILWIVASGCSIDPKALQAPSPVSPRLDDLFQSAQVAKASIQSGSMTFERMTLDLSDEILNTTELFTLQFIKQEDRIRMRYTARKARHNTTTIYDGENHFQAWHGRNETDLEFTQTDTPDDSYSFLDGFLVNAGIPTFLQDPDDFEKSNARIDQIEVTDATPGLTVITALKNNALIYSVTFSEDCGGRCVEQQFWRAFWIEDQDGYRRIFEWNRHSPQDRTVYMDYGQVSEIWFPRRIVHEQYESTKGTRPAPGSLFPEPGAKLSRTVEYRIRDCELNIPLDERLFDPGNKSKQSEG